MIKSSSQSRSSSFLRSRFHDYTGKRGRSRTSKPTQNHHVCFQSFGRVNGFVTIAQKADDDDCDDVVDRREFDLLIVGPGVLGTLVAKKWIEKFPNCRVVGQTKTEKNHQMLKKKRHRGQDSVEGSDRWEFAGGGTFSVCRFLGTTEWFGWLSIRD